MDTSKRICLGVITGAHGLQGAVRIKSYTQVPGDIGSFGPLGDVDGGRAFEVRVERETPKGLIARIAGVNDRTGAEALKGTELFVERGALPAEDEDEFYYTDLIGLLAEGPDGKRLGIVKSMNNFGAGEMIEIELDAGGSAVIPFTKSAVPVVDVEGARIVADPPAGLMPEPKATLARRKKGRSKKEQRGSERNDG